MIPKNRLISGIGYLPYVRYNTRRVAVFNQFFGPLNNDTTKSRANEPTKMMYRIGDTARPKTVACGSPVPAP